MSRLVISVFDFFLCVILVLYGTPCLQWFRAQSLMSSARSSGAVGNRGLKEGLEGKKAELEVKIKELEQKTQGIELGTIVVGPEAEVTAPVAAPELKAPESAKSAKPEAAKKSAAKKTSEPVGGMEGKILVVNRDYNFAVINLGEKDGVAIGNVFSVYHNNKYLGDATVEKVHDSMSAAGFTSADMRKKVTEGDKVIRKNK